MERETGLLLQAEELAHVTVHHLGTQTAEEGQQQGLVVGQTQLCASLLTGIAEEVTAHRRAGDNHFFRVFVVRFGVLKSHHDNVHDLGQGLGGQAGNGVRLMHRRRDTALGSRLDHGEGGVAAGTHHQIRLEFVQNGSRLLFRTVQIDQRSQIMLDGGRAQGAIKAGDGDRLQVKAFLRNQSGLHAAVCAHEEHPAVGITLLKQTSQRHGGIDMSGGTAAGKQNIHTSSLS